jgi:hypothetical protein
LPFEEKAGITQRMKEKDKQRKTDAKQDNVSTIQALGGRDIPFGAWGKSSSSRESRERGRGRRRSRSRSKSRGETGAVAIIVAVAIAAGAGARVGGEIRAVATIVAVAVAVCSSFTQPPAMLGKGGQLRTHGEGWGGQIVRTGASRAVQLVKMQLFGAAGLTQRLCGTSDWQK